MTSNLPTGTVTFLFTDIEDSTRLWQEHPQAMEIMHARHNAVLSEAIHANHGYIFQIVGDSFSAAFHNTADGLRAALSAQRALIQASEGIAENPRDGENEADTPQLFAIRVRMGLHTGAAELLNDGSGKYDGYLTIASTQRVMSVAYGGQILLSQTTYDLLQNDLPEGSSLRDMGEHRLKGLRAPLRLYQLVAPGLLHEFPAIKSLAAFPNNLPVQLTSFVGREKEITDVKGLLGAARLVTLTGSGGTGKTRLAQEVGSEVSQTFPYGVWLIELAPLGDPSQIIPTMAQVFGLQELPFASLTMLVTDYLREKKALLLLDNCEHLIEACAHLADQLLHQCAGIKILASSRESLGIAGEIVYRIPPLADQESTQLFVARARAVNPMFTQTVANASAIARICSRLDGIPLAIELAAARVKLLSPEQIAARLDDRFRLLIGGSRTATPRQQTLRATIDWSYALLSEEEQRVLQYASVFVGGWMLDALEAVSEDPNTMEQLEQLVNKSLVVTEERESEMRYFMLETIRQYAREKLFDAQQASLARDRHFDYFDHLLEQIWKAFRSSDILPLVKRSADEVENVRAALEWGLENHIEENVRLAANFCSLSSMLGNQAEGVTIARTAVERAKELPPVDRDARLHRQKLIARALYAQGMVGLILGDMPFVLTTLKEAIDISRVTGDKLILGYCLGTYYIASTFVNVQDGEEAAQEGFKIFSQEVSDPFGLGLAYLNMARIASARGDELEKQRYFGKVREMIREMPSSYQVGLFVLGMALDERKRGHNQTAKSLIEEGLDIFNRIGSLSYGLLLRSELGHIARLTGDPDQARLIYQETITGWQEFGHRAAIAHQLECFAFIAISGEEPQRAGKLMGAADALRERIQSPMTDYESVEYDQSIDRLRSMLTEAEFDALWAEGRSMSMEMAIQLALESQPPLRS